MVARSNPAVSMKSVSKISAVSDSALLASSSSFVASQTLRDREMEQHG